LKEGDLSENTVSQVFFRDNNLVEADLHFGCSIYGFNGGNDLEQIMDFFTQLATD
jgi:hypothetical protein